MRVVAAVLAVLALSAAAPPDPVPGDFASAADVTAAVAAIERDMKPGQGFAWRPLVRGGEAVAALEVWRKPGRPAAHPTEAEYAIVVAGEGTLVSGGRLVGGSQTRPGLVEGDRIEGGTTRPLRRGDVMLIPAGAPHWFGITGDRLVLLGTKIKA